MQKKTKNNNLWVKLYVFYLRIKSRFFVEPYLRYKENTSKAKKQKEYIRGFNSLTGVDYTRVLSIMDKDKSRPDNYYEHINEELTKHRKLMQSQKFSYTPKFYEPEIIDIHNENLNPNVPSLKELIYKEELNGLKQLYKQERELGYHPRSCYAPQPKPKDVAIKAAKIDIFKDLEEKLNNISKMEETMSDLRSLLPENQPYYPSNYKLLTKTNPIPSKKSWYKSMGDLFKKKS
jgi:hypothetical protein